jgi:transcriptional regulator of acetoin/glycerol metabolism
VILAPGPTIVPDDLGLRPAATRPVVAEAGDFPTLEALEREHIVRALARTNGARAEAAELLGIDRKTLYRRLRALGLADGEDA